jgi:hypothetical protein
MKYLTNLTIGFWVLLLVLLMAGQTSATVLQIPYTPSDGKKTGSVEISTANGLDPDSVKLGLLTIRLYDGVKVALAVCGFKPTTVVQIVGGFSVVHQTADTSADWNQLGTYPHLSNLVKVDSIKAWDGDMSSGVERTAPGFALFKSGQTNTCSGAEYFMEPNWNRVVFVSFGSGINYRAKLSFQAKSDTSYGMLPRFQVLRSITMYYVITANSDDVSGGPIAVRPEARTRARGSSGLKVDYDVYNPLGIRLGRERGRFEPSLSVPR